MSSPKKRGPISATELMASLEQDEDYQRWLRQKEEEANARDAMLRQAEAPIVADLHAAGVEVESVWDLVNTSDPYPDALPVLIDHFDKGGYPDWVMASLGRALAVKPSVFYWDRLKARYLDSHGRGEEEGAAVALAACATTAQLDDLIRLASDDSKGTVRILFLEKIKRLGGQRGQSLIEGWVNDPALGQEATRLLKTRKRR